jgi:exopolyphosphatase/guanosine-5'-triphosphate,3'-diphosphate pyrophosphatase
MTRAHRRPLAAIDIGTNSFHLIVAEIDPATKRFKILDREKEIVRLGSSPTDMKHITESAMVRGTETLKRFKVIADAAKAPIRAIATSAVREAINQDEFIRRIKNETGITIEVASGVEEARLIYLGVLQALPVYNRKILLVDIGGGSTEFLVGEKRKVFYDNSVKLGSVRLTERFFASSKLTKKTIKRCREYILLTMNPLVRAIRKQGYEAVIGTSGTINNIAKMVQCARGGNKSITTLNNYVFARSDFDSVLEKILGAKDTEERTKLEGLDSGRSDIIVAGALILEQVFKELEIEQLTVSEFALREGIIFDTIEKKFRPTGVHRLEDIRYDSVLHLAENLGYEKQHSNHVAALALRIFDQTKILHHLDDIEREYLEAAAILHEVGFFLAHSQHHRHSYYLIRNAELLGFTENEKEIIANVARYHRKSHPKLKHEGYRRLNAQDQLVVSKLAAILRITDGLDRTHSSVVADILCRNLSKTVIFSLKRAGHSSVQMEIQGAIRKKELFEEIFNVEVKFKLK